MSTTVPAAPVSRQRGERLAAPLGTVATLAVATLALRLRDPHVGGSWGLCPSAAVGLACPLCGGLRAVNDLTHGEVLAAASSNLLFVATLPLTLTALLLWVVGAWQGRDLLGAAVPPRVRRPLLWVGVAVAVAFTLARNTPAGAWLAP